MQQHDYKFPEDWNIEHSGERRILDREKVRAEIERLRSPATEAEIEAAAEAIKWIDEWCDPKIVAREALEAAERVRSEASASPAGAAQPSGRSSAPAS